LPVRVIDNDLDHLTGVVTGIGDGSVRHAARQRRGDRETDKYFRLHKVSLLIWTTHEPSHETVENSWLDQPCDLHRRVQLEVATS
jgi:hypothetical protein